MTDILDKLPDEELPEEEHEALLLMCGHGIGPMLSPATQAVRDAARKSTTQAWSNATHQRFNQGIVAALRAAALYCKRDRLPLLTIAEELEGMADIPYQPLARDRVTERARAEQIPGYTEARTETASSPQI